VRFRFGQFEADSARFTLTRRGEPVRIEPKPLRLLLHLLARHPATSSKEEILQTLWADQQVTDHSLTRAVRALRRALGEDATRLGLIHNVRGHGYRVASEVERIADEPREPGSSEGGVFVGREQVLADLREAFERVREGSGGTVLLAGEPGIGKTRTVEELVRHLEVSGAEVAWGRALEAAGAPALWPWLQVLRSLARARDAATLVSQLGAGAAEVGALVPEVRERLPRLEAARGDSPEHARFRFLDAVSQWLARASVERSLVLVFDDLHWADPMSLELFAFAASELRNARVLLLGTYRHVAAPANEALNDLVAALARLPCAKPALQLAGLSLDEVERLVAGSSGATLSADQVRRIYERSGGNPFFVRELLRLGESGAGNAGITPGVKAVVGRRLDSLDKPGRELLEAAAVVGRAASVELLEELLRLPDSRIWDGLEQAEGAGFTEEVPEEKTPTFRFVHAILQETVYATIPRRSRMALHRRVGEALEQLHRGDLEPWVPALAHHFGEAVGLGERERAVDYAVRAGRQAGARFAFEEAARCYARALDCLGDQGDPARRCDLLLDRGEACVLAGAGAEGREAFLKSAAIARGVADTTRLARAAFAFSTAVEEIIFANPEAIGLLEEALERLEEARSPLRIRLLGQLATLLLPIELGQGQRGLALAEETVREARRLGDLPTLAEALARRTLILQQRPLDRSAEERMQSAEEALAAAQAAGRADLEIEARRQRIALALELGDAKLLDAEIHHFAAESDRVRIRSQRHHAASYLAMRAMHTGRFDDARVWIDAAETLADPSDVRLAVFTPLTQRLLMPPDPEEDRRLEGILAGLIEHFPQFPHWRVAQLHFTYEAGRDAEAEQRLDEILVDDVPSALGRDVGWHVSVASLAQICAAFGRREPSRRLFELLAPYARYNVVVGYGIACLGPVSLYLGDLATVLDRRAEAEGHLAAALASAEQMGARPWEARAHFGLARLRLAQGDRAAARQASEAAAAIAGSLGMEVLRARAQQLVD